MRVLFVTSEVYPLVKTGGLADAAASLPAALADMGNDVRLILPAYPAAVDRATHVGRVRTFGRLLGRYETALLSARLPDSGLPVWLVHCPALFDRDGGLYQDAQGKDWRDNAHRFALLNMAASLVAKGAADERWIPDVVHGNDWHAGLMPFLLAAETGKRPRTIQTIHNLGYQGLFPYADMEALQLPHAHDLFRAGEFYGKFSFLKTGIVFADRVTTVSPTYAAEIATPECGFGLDGVIRARRDGVTGILNGADYALWDPHNDPHLLHNYAARDLGAKRINKMTLQHEMGLDVAEDAPLVAWMSRLAHQKMPDVALQALPALIEDGIRFALVAEGEAQYETAFRELAARHPRQVAVRIGYDEAAAHRLLAGADLLLHPARYEPCGLSPLYALRYGTIPIVRRSGGLADSVVDATFDTLRNDRATGFSFDEPTAEAMVGATRRAMSMFRMPLQWRKLQANAMRQDFGWKRSAERYAALYEAEPGGDRRTAAPKPRGKARRLTA